MLSLWEAGVKNVAVAFGLQIGLGLINYFLRIDADKIYLAFNNDEDKKLRWQSSCREKLKQAD